ncbi:hypothetical protein BKA69DRAFT_1126105 [Paraphysoderma sedebokerense]|nr:hypothetical protein BKA69DRAFT_1126105 [Paraphysoderma sedebokerense]
MPTAIEVSSNRPFEPTGNFEEDFASYCQRETFNSSFQVRKLKYPLPPIPLPIYASAETGADGAVNNQSSKVKSENANSPITSNSPPLMQSGTENNEFTYSSNYKFKPTILIDATDDVDEENRVGVRRWKIELPVMKAVCDILPTSTTVTELSFTCNGLTDGHVNLLVSVLPSTGIRSLQIDQNPIRTETIFAGLLYPESQLESLSLKSNKITNVGAAALAAALKSNKSLSVLNLWCNEINNEGASFLGEMLKSNQKLISLSIGNNQIGDQGAIAISKALSKSPLSPEEIVACKKTLSEEKKQMDEEKSKSGKPRPTGSAGNLPAQKEDPKSKKPPPKPAQKDIKTTNSTPANPKTKNSAQELPESDKSKGKLSDTKTPNKSDKSKSTASGSSNKNIKKTGKIDKDDAIEEHEATQQNPLSESSIIEINGQHYFWGNRTLLHLNLSYNKITANGLKSLYDAILDQNVNNVDEIASVRTAVSRRSSVSANSPPGHSKDEGQSVKDDQLLTGKAGLWGLALQGNDFNLHNPTHVQLQNLVSSRNPYVKNQDLSSLENIDSAGE